MTFRFFVESQALNFVTNRDCYLILSMDKCIDFLENATTSPYITQLQQVLVNKYCRLTSRQNWIPFKLRRPKLDEYAILPNISSSDGRPTRERSMKLFLGLFRSRVHCCVFTSTWQTFQLSLSSTDASVTLQHKARIKEIWFLQKWNWLLIAYHSSLTPINIELEPSTYSHTSQPPINLAWLFSLFGPIQSFPSMFSKFCPNYSLTKFQALHI